MRIILQKSYFDILFIYEHVNKTTMYIKMRLSYKRFWSSYFHIPSFNTIYMLFYLIVHQFQVNPTRSMIDPSSVSSTLMSVIPCCKCIKEIQCIKCTSTKNKKKNPKTEIFA